MQDHEVGELYKRKLKQYTYPGVTVQRPMLARDSFHNDFKLIRKLVEERAHTLCHMWQKWDECDRQKHHSIEALRDFGIDPDEYNHG
jgi:hypothetical protein